MWEREDLNCAVWWSEQRGEGEIAIRRKRGIVWYMFHSYFCILWYSCKMWSQLTGSLVRHKSIWPSTTVFILGMES